MVQLTDVQKEVIQASGHQLVTGGPGSGKTTVSILKAAKIAFIIEPHVRFKGEIGEQATMFFTDPSGNELGVWSER